MTLIESLCPGVFDSHTLGQFLLLHLRFPLGSLNDFSPSLLNIKVPQDTILGLLLSSLDASLGEAFSVIPQDSIIILNSLKPIPPAHQFPELWILEPFCLLYLMALRYLTHLCSVVMCQTLF